MKRITVTLVLVLCVIGATAFVGPSIAQDGTEAPTPTTPETPSTDSTTTGDTTATSTPNSPTTQTPTATPTPTGEPDIAVEPRSLAFGNVTVGSSTTGTVEIINNGTAPLEVNNTVITGKSNQEFVLSGAATPFTLAPGDNRTVSVEFTPDERGDKNATLRINSTDADEPDVAVGLTGTGLAPAIKTQPRTVPFRKVSVDSTTSKTIIVRNVGNAPLEVSATDLSGRAANAYQVSAGGAPFTLAPGERQSVGVSFSPPAKGPHKATLRIASNDASTPTSTVRLVGVGAPTPFKKPFQIGKGRSGFKLGPPQDLDGDGLYEDVNGDGKLNGRDKRTLNQIIMFQKAGTLDLTASQTAAFDLNRDGEFDYHDAKALKRGGPRRGR